MSKTRTTNETEPQPTAVLQKDPGPLPGLIHTLRELREREKIEQCDRDRDQGKSQPEA